jgi:N-acetyl-gamma-glutamyl-phosphate reductase
MNKIELNQKNVGIFGASGYSGQELINLLNFHPLINKITCFNRDSQINSQTLKGLDYLFLATPIESSLELVPKLLPFKIPMIDLSGAFRLTQARGDFSDPLNNEYLCTKNITPTSLFPYGLRPWCQEKRALFTTNPGCYASSILMCLIPLLLEGLISHDNIVIDSKSGTTGAGKKAKDHLQFSEIFGNVVPYKVGIHQHLPEIKFYAEKFSKVKINPHFSTGLIPVSRGIISSIYANLNLPLSSDVSGEDQVFKCFKKYYEDDSLVDVEVITDDIHQIQLSKIVGSPKTKIFFKVIDEKIYLISLIDNLLKGASSSAVENFNAYFNYPTTLGLEHLFISDQQKNKLIEIEMNENFNGANKEVSYESVA